MNRLGLWLASAIAVISMVPGFACLGAPFSAPGGAGGSTGTTSSSSSSGTVVCNEPLIPCHDTCVDAIRDNAHCGACDKACGDAQTCVDGECQCPTAAPDLCDNECVNRKNDEQNCGQCGMACPAGQTCKASACQCPTGTKSCPDGCVDTTLDANNCGACDNVCPDGGGCVDSECQATCAFEICGETCTNTEEDKNNCGACDHVCLDAASCNGGECTCPSPQGYCENEGCFNTQTDKTHCGEQCVSCTGGKVCSDGACECPSTHVDCAGVCKPRSADSCDACGMACSPGLTCDLGAGCDCPIGAPVCAGRCADPYTDTLACGLSCVPCVGAEICINGSCECQDPLTRCPDGCTDTHTDPKNCGDCGNVCNDPSPACVNGQCAPKAAMCSPLQKPCNGACYPASYFLTSVVNCGACGNQCKPGQVCVGGACSNFFVPPGCDSCPCPLSCGPSSTCCPVNNTNYCIDGNVACPN